MLEKMLKKMKFLAVDEGHTTADGRYLVFIPAHGNGAHFVASCLPPLGELPQRKGLVTTVGGGHPWV
ncbi:unnamed protein product [Prunus armeniaca]